MCPAQTPVQGMPSRSDALSEDSLPNARIFAIIPCTKYITLTMHISPMIEIPSLIILLPIAAEAKEPFRAVLGTRRSGGLAAGWGKERDRWRVSALFR